MLLPITILHKVHIKKCKHLVLEIMYREDENFQKFCAQLDGLAFLPIPDVLRSTEYKKSFMPDEAIPLVDYFDYTYVNRTYRRIGQHNNSNSSSNFSS